MMTPLTTRLRTWLNTIPIKDPIQRQMASLLQAILLGLMILIVLDTLLRMLLSVASAREGLTLPVGNLLGFLVVLLPFVLLRRGFFHAALWLIIGVLILTPALAILIVFDLPNNGGVLFQFTLAIFLAGLLSERRTLVIVFALSAVLVALAASRVPDAGTSQAELALQTALNFIIFNGLITLFLDRFGSALRSALTAAHLRESELQGEIANRQQAEARFRLVIESAPNAIIMVNDTGSVVLFNSKAEEYFGYSRAEVIGKSVEMLVPDRFRGRHPMFRASFLGQPQARPMGIGRDLFALRKDGSEFPVEIGLAPVDAPEGRLVRATIVDITERKQLEQKRVEVQERFEKIFNFSPMSMALSSVVDGKYLEVNQAFLNLMGYSKEEVIGRTSLDLNLIHPEDRGKILNELRSGTFRSSEVPIHPKNGEVKQIRVYAQEITIGAERFFLSMNEDITERKRAQEEILKLNQELEQRVADRTAELSTANSLLNAMLEYVPDHIFFKDTQSRFIRNSRSQAKMMGLNSPSETIGKTDFDFFPHAQRAFDEEQQIIHSGEPIIDLEEHVVWPDGRETWVSTTKVPLRDPGGEIMGIFGIAHDITDRKRAEDALHKAKAQLEAANKELESFSYSVSHDLRAPLRAIDGYSRMLLEDYEPLLDAEGKRLFGVVRSEAQRMGQLIDDLLAFSRLGRAEMKFVHMDMRRMAEEIFNELTTPETRTRIEFQLGDVPGAWGDPSLIRQVWVNLLSNAIKFSSAKERPVIQVKGEQQADEVTFQVCDNGAGFDMKYAAKLFGVFQRLHSEREFEGTGVGLAIIQRIVSRHGGRVWAEGEPGGGATFSFALPQKGDRS